MATCRSSALAAIGAAGTADAAEVAEADGVADETADAVAADSPAAGHRTALRCSRHFSTKPKHRHSDDEALPACNL